jgi:chemotaxis protein MotB
MRKKKHPEHVNHERWLVSYADFITLLFAFFTTLYAISTVDQKKAGKLQFSMMTAFNLDFFPSKAGVSGAAPSPALLSPLTSQADPVPRESKKERKTRRQAAVKALSQRIEKLLRSSELGKKIRIRQERGAMVLSLDESGFFGSGRAEVEKESLDPLNGLAEQLASEKESIEIVVEGHTDNTPMKGGRYGSNWALSTARATAVLQLFLEKHGFDPSHVSAAGYGEFRPVAPNETKEGRARNRRVDIVVKVRTDGPESESKMETAS